jgi:hypothetical protein
MVNNFDNCNELNLSSLNTLNHAEYSAALNTLNHAEYSAALNTLNHAEYSAALNTLNHAEYCPSIHRDLKGNPLAEGICDDLHNLPE